MLTSGHVVGLGTLPFRSLCKFIYGWAQTREEVRFMQDHGSRTCEKQEASFIGMSNDYVVGA